MSKKTLLTLFHMSSTEYENEYNTRFNAEDTIHLDIKIGNNPAFFCRTSNIYEKIISIYKADKITTSICARLPNEAIAQFTSYCLVGEIILTNKVEGINSSRHEIEQVLDTLTSKDKNLRFEGIVRKYQKLMNSDEVELNTCENIRALYDDIFLNEIKRFDKDNIPDGEIFRKGSVSVYSETNEEIHHGLQPECKITDAMTKALAFLHDDSIEPLFRIAVFHYLFGYIHPFYDGNGRTSRFICSYLLSKQLNQLIGFRISYTIKEKIKEYYAAFKTCNDPFNRGDLTPFLEMFVDVVDTSVKNLNAALEKRANLFEAFTQMIGDLPHGNDEKIRKLYDLLIQGMLFSDKGISKADLCKYGGMSTGTLTKRLNMIPPELLSQQICRKRCYYKLNSNELEVYTRK